MSRKLLQLPSMSRVVAGAKATLELVTGFTYFNIVVSATGTLLTAAMFGRVNVFVNGKVIATYANLQRLMDLNAYYNRSVDTPNEFMIHFFRADMMDIIYRRAPGIGTGDVQTMHVTIDIDLTAPGDLAMNAHAFVDPEPQALGTFFKVLEFPFASAVAGKVEIDRLPRGAFYSAIHLFKPDVSAVEVNLDGNKIVDASKLVLEREEKEASPVKRVPQSAVATHIDWLLEGDIAQSIDTSTVQDFRTVMTLDTAGAVDIVTETLDTLGGV